MTEPLRDVEAELRQGEALFDARLAALRGETPARDSRRRAAIQELIEHGSTAGEREAAEAALQRLDAAEQEARDEEDYFEAVAHGEA